MKVRERVKNVILTALTVSAVFLTCRLWLSAGVAVGGSDFFSWDDVPIVGYFLHYGEISIPKENLSKPRKIVINDGELWVPYYNTDDAFDTLDEKTSGIIAACLSGAADYEEITYSEWLGSLEEESVYVEYPITVTPKMLATILGASEKGMPDEIKRLKDAIIIPKGESAVELALRDSDGGAFVKFTLESAEYAFPEDVLRLYAAQNRREGYYEFAFSTLLGSMGSGNVTVDDLVLFSDNSSEIQSVFSENPLTREKYGRLLESFSFAAQPLRHYRDEQNCENYVENYATVKISDDGYIEYTTVADDKGIALTGAERGEYELLNSAIDFAEKVWSSVSDDTLDVLVSGVSESDGEVKFTFDCYVGGREVAVNISGDDREPLYHAIEMTIRGGRITSYRQYMRSYAASGSGKAQESFVSALDCFVELFESSEESVTITDIYPGYFDDGSTDHLDATWLAKTDSGEARVPMNAVPETTEDASEEPTEVTA